MSDQLTIVLTLKDRSPFTRRWMRYMNDIACAYPILIADGGSDGDIEARLSDTGNYPRLRYVYVRYPPDTDYNDYYRKLADIVGRVRTPYVLLADNDDFFLLDAAAELLQFLDANPDYVSCGGSRVVLKLLNGGSITGCDAGGSYEARVDMRPKAISASDAVDRVRYFLENVKRLYLWSSWYAVHRTSALVHATATARSHAFRDPVAHELHVHIAILLAGRVHQIDRPWFVNQAGSSQVTAALEAQGSVAQRFAVSCALDDVHRSIESATVGWRDADRAAIHEALERWLRRQADPSSAPPTRVIRLPMLERYILSAS